LVAVALGGCGSDRQRRSGGGVDLGALVDGAGSIHLRSCSMTVDVFEVPRAEVRRLVPGRYRISRFAATGDTAVDVWVFECRRLSRGGATDRGILSLVSAVVRDPRLPGPPAGIAPNRYHHYLLWAQTTSPALGRLLGAAGVSSPVVEGLRRVRTRGVLTKVPWSGSPFEVAMPRLATLDQRHRHRNVWWQDHEDGTTSRIDLNTGIVNDRYCDPGPCSTVTAAAGSPFARVLGARSRTAYSSFDHLRLDATLSLLAPRCLHLARDRAGHGPPCRRGG
jgi:hypothetical protein